MRKIITIQLALEYADRGVVLFGGEILMDDTIYNVLAHKEVLHKANLKETSISRLAELFGVEDKSSFMEQIIHLERRGK